MESTQLASALDGAQEPAIQASFGLQMSHFFLILLSKTNGLALCIKEEVESSGGRETERSDGGERRGYFSGDPVILPVEERRGSPR